MTTPSGAIHDIGYRHYTGPRLGSGYAMRTLLLEGLRGAFGFGRSAKSKVLPLILLGLLLFGAVVFAAMAILTNDIEQAVRPPDFVSLTAPVIAIFVASQAPQLVSRDLRFRTVALYFSRPIEHWQYLTAKYLAMSAAIALFIALPMTVITAGSLLAKFPVKHQLADYGRGIACLLVTALVYAAVALLVAAFTPRRGLGVAAIIAVFLISTTIAGVLQHLGSENGNENLENYGGLVSPTGIVGTLNAWISQIPIVGDAPPTTTQGLIYSAAAIALVGVCLGLLLLRYRKVSVS